MTAAPSPTQSDRRTLMVGKGWIQAVALVVIFGFFVMGILAFRTYTASMPEPDKVVTQSGEVLFTGEDITAGQQLFLARGLMQYGSISAGGVIGTMHHLYFSGTPVEHMALGAFYFEARTLGYLTTPGNRLLEWGRMPGDLIFIIGGVLPFLWMAWLGLRYSRRGPTTEELPQDVLFTEKQPVAAGSSPAPPS
jgi:nitric oxide reductase large subunit